MVQVFKENSSSWTDTKTVMTDKDFVERKVFKEEFPEASLMICLFHLQRSFRRSDYSKNGDYHRREKPLPVSLDILMIIGMQVICSGLRV